MRDLILRLSTRQRSAIYAGVLLVDGVLALFPPLYWMAGTGSPATSLTYFVGGGAVMVLSVYLLFYVEHVRGELDPASTRTDVRSDEEVA